MFRNTRQARAIAGRPPTHPDLLIALRALEARGLSYAEMWRTLCDAAVALGIAPPSYPTVRRLLLEERHAADLRSERVERVVRELLAGRVPRRVF